MFNNGLLNCLSCFSDCMKLPKFNNFNNKNRIFSTCIAVKSLGSLIGGQLISEKVGLTTPQLFRYTAIGTFIYYVITFWGFLTPLPTHCFHMEVKVAVLNAISQSCI